MRELTKRSGVIGAFALMSLLLLVNAVVTRRQLAAQLDSQDLVAHTREVLYQLSETESVLKDAERGQRGYLYTADKSYLLPYTQATHEIGAHLDRLTFLVKDSPQQEKRLDVLRFLISHKMKELTSTIGLFQSNRGEEAKALVRSNLGRETMTSIHDMVGQMEAEEYALVTERSRIYEQDTIHTIRFIYLATTLGLIGLALLAFYILHQMTLRQHHARQLLEREEWFRVTLTSLGDAVIATDEKGCVTYLNPLAEKLIGTTSSESMGKNVESVFPIFNEQTLAPVENPIDKVMAEGRIVGLANHTVLRNTAGDLIPIEDSASPIRDKDDKLIGAVLVFRDATQERKVQEMLRKSDKLSAAARMSATVAHEINNPLEAVGNLIFLTRAIEGLPEELYSNLNLAEQELERVAHITKQTLGFHREARSPECLELHELLDYVVRLSINKITTKRITIHRDFSACPPILGISSELKQVFANLLNNAADAVTEGGNIWIRIFSEKDASGCHVHAEIRDDGPGISEDKVQRIFEPFYTTKKDVGTGLGLWVTKEIVERHKGLVQFLPLQAEQRGATFLVSLPKFTPAD